MYVTRRQKEMMDFLDDYIVRNGYAPTIEETADHFGLRSLATVHKHLTNLQKKGLIKRDWNRSRALELVPTTVKVQADRAAAARPRGRRLPHRGDHVERDDLRPRGHGRPAGDLRPAGEGRFDDRGADPRRRLRHRGEPPQRARRRDGDRAPRRRERDAQEALPRGRRPRAPARPRTRASRRSTSTRTACASRAWSSACCGRSSSPTIRSAVDRPSEWSAPVRCPLLIRWPAPPSVSPAPLPFPLAPVLRPPV